MNLSFNKKEIIDASKYVYSNLKENLNQIYYYEDLEYENVLLRFDKDVKKYLYNFWENNESLQDVAFDFFYNEMSEHLNDFYDFDSILSTLTKKRYLN